MAFVMQKINPNILKHENAAERSQPSVCGCLVILKDWTMNDPTMKNENYIHQVMIAI